MVESARHRADGGSPAISEGAERLLAPATQSHLATYLRDPWSGNEEAIDFGMVDLIEQLWRLGIRTRFCCQGDPGELAYVHFPGSTESGLLVAALADQFDGYLGVGPRFERNSRRRWQWETYPSRRDAAGVNWPLPVTLYLPLEDVEMIAQYLSERVWVPLPRDPA